MKKNITNTIFVISSLLLSISCSNEKITKMTLYQKSISEKLDSITSFSSFIYAKDTVKLVFPQEVKVGSSSTIHPLLSGYVIYNRDAKALFVFDKKGNYISEISREGEGPGEFRNITAITTDLKQNIYLYDLMLKRISKFNMEGTYLSSFKVSRNSDNIRHICIGVDDTIYLHHAPLGEESGFISVYQDGEFKRYLMEENNNDYAGYYYRGFLSGNIVCDKKGNLFVTNIFNHKITKISRLYDISTFGVKSDSFRELKKARSGENLTALSENHRASTIPFNLYLVDNERLLLNELLEIDTNNRKNAKLYFMVYDITGLFLGQIDIPDDIWFFSSDGNNLFSFINRPNMLTGKYSNPMIIIYGVRKWDENN